MSQFVKKINELTEIIEAGPGVTGDDGMIIQSDENAGDNLTYKIKFSNLRNYTVKPTNYADVSTSSETEVIGTSAIVVQQPIDGGLYNASINQLGSALQKDYAVFFQSASQDLVQDTWQSIVWSSPVSYTGSLSQWWSISNPSRIVFKGADTGAVYKVTFVGVMDTNTNGYRGARLVQSNGTPTIPNPERYFAPSSNYTVANLHSVLIEAVSSNYFQAQLFSSAVADVPTIETQTYIIVERVN